MPKPSKPTTVIYANTEDKMTGPGGTVSITFTGAKFTTAPKLAVSTIIGSGAGAGNSAWVTVTDVSTAGATLTLALPNSTGAKAPLDSTTQVQVSFTAVQSA